MTPPAAYRQGGPAKRRFVMRLTILAAALLTMPPAGTRVAAPRGDRGGPVRPESRIWITGSSNIRRFSCRAGGLSGDIALRADATHQPTLAGRNATQAPSL